MTGQEVRTWSAHRVTRILLCLPILAAGVVTLAAWEFWPLILVAAIPLYQVSRRRVQLTDDELLLRDDLSSTRIPRSDVSFAQFQYHLLFGCTLEVHRRDGTVVSTFIMPKLSSTEWSGDPPGPDSVATHITRWANATGSDSG
jgi:hypothetical protein